MPVLVPQLEKSMSKVEVIGLVKVALVQGLPDALANWQLEGEKEGQLVYLVKKSDSYHLLSTFAVFEGLFIPKLIVLGTVAAV